MKNTPPANVPGYGSIPTGNQQGGYDQLTQEDLLPAGDYGKVDTQNFEAQCALLAKNEQLAKQKAREDHYWRQRTWARKMKMQQYAQEGPDTKALSGDQYRLEAMDPKHRIGELLNLFMDEYNSIRPSQPFLEWVDSMTPMAQLQIIRKVMEARGHRAAIKPQWIAAFNKGVRYMDASERGSYQITIANGLLYQNGKIFDTKDMKTEFSGNGVAIFVESSDKTFYSSSHVWGRLHHSSFLSGQAIRSAGEWKVTNGKIDWISGKSGHYKPTMDQLINALNDLKFQNALNGSIAKVFDIQNNQEDDIDANFLTAASHYFRVWKNG